MWPWPYMAPKAIPCKVSTSACYIRSFITITIVIDRKQPVSRPPTPLSFRNLIIRICKIENLVKKPNKNSLHPWVQKKFNPLPACSNYLPLWPEQTMINLYSTVERWISLFQKTSRVRVNFWAHYHQLSFITEVTYLYQWSYLPLSEVTSFYHQGYLPLSLKSSTMTTSFNSSGGDMLTTLWTVRTRVDHPSLWNTSITLAVGSLLFSG